MVVHIRSILSDKISLCGNSGIRIEFESETEPVTCSRCISFYKKKKVDKKMTSRQSKPSKRRC